MNWRSALLLLCLPLACVALGWLTGRSSAREIPLDELAIARNWQHGELPSWEPRVGMGVPLAAASLGGPWYPPNVAKWLFGPAEAAPWLALVRLWLAGAGVFLFLTRRGFGRGFALALALVLQGGGWALALITFASVLDAALWLPWMAWAIDGFARREARAGLWSFATTTQSLLAGFPPIALIAIALALLYALARRAWFAPAWIALGVLGGALHWIPMLEARGASGLPERTNTGSLDSEAIAAIAEAAGDGRVVRYDTSVKAVLETLPLARYGMSDLSLAMDSLPRRMQELLAGADANVLQQRGLLHITQTGAFAHPALDLARVTCVLARVPLTHPRLTLVFSEPGLYVYRRTCPLPLARVVPSALTEVPTDFSTLGLLGAGQLDFAHETLITHADRVPDSRTSRAREPFVPGALTVQRLADDRLDVRVQASSGGWLVMHEQWVPGWKATVNGEDRDIVRVDHVLRAIAIPPGDCMVRTKYEPDSLRLGAWLSLIALALAVLLGWFTGAFPTARAPARLG